MRQNLGTALTVTATEKWLAAVQAGNAFGLYASQNAVAAQFSYVQLYNPAASGKTLLLRAVVGSTGAAAAIGFSMDNTQRTTDAGAGINLLSGAAAGVGHVRQETNAALQGAQFGSVLTAVGAAVIMPIEWFAQLAPGQGLTTYCTIVNIQLVTWFLWTEA